MSIIIENSVYRRIDQIHIVTGNIVHCANNYSLVQCITDCMLIVDCSAILFKLVSQDQERCNLIMWGNNVVNISNWNGYELYTFDSDTINLGIGVGTPIGWTSGKPNLYFPLDSDTGTRLGANSGNIDFVNDAIIGKSFHNPSNGNTASYYNLGTYSHSEYCFVEPEACSHGFSIALWLKIKGHAAESQGIISTLIPSAQQSYAAGFVMNWNDELGFLRFIVRQRIDNMEFAVAIPNDLYLADYSLNTWNHYVLTYRYIANGNSIIDMYIDGVPRPNSDKKIRANITNNGQPYHGTLAIGCAYAATICGNNVIANVKIDELAIWEHVLPQCDVIRLYNAYVYQP